MHVSDVTVPQAELKKAYHDPGTSRTREPDGQQGGDGDGDGGGGEGEGGGGGGDGGRGGANWLMLTPVSVQASLHHARHVVRPSGGEEESSELMRPP